LEVQLGEVRREAEAARRDAVAAQEAQSRAALEQPRAADTTSADLERAAAPAGEPAVVSRPDRDTATQRVAEIAARTRGDETPVDDDLKRVHGIGPVIERMLKEMGITSFRQIARFESDDIAFVAAALNAFPDRIQRDDWMSSAAQLHEEKYGTAP
jgi:NADH-quinone oxidoreductase subunit E